MRIRLRWMSSGRTYCSTCAAEFQVQLLPRRSMWRIGSWAAYQERLSANSGSMTGSVSNLRLLFVGATEVDTHRSRESFVLCSMTPPK
jgi:hypothetical protein